MPPKGDWLIFELQDEVPKDIVVYTLRETPLKTGEDVSFMGYPYKYNNPIKVYGKYNGLTDDKNLKLEVPKGAYNGCSGGPVLDKKGKVIGLVSMGYFRDKQMIFEPASINYFIEVINHYKNKS